jgi:rfaE bifunctional protein nucleotidyltransferase chain/domain
MGRIEMTNIILWRDHAMSRNGKVIVYAAGTWDMFHVGHLNILRAAKALGDTLIVGVKTDDVVLEFKGYYPLLGYEDRAAVVAACRYVDVVVPQRTQEKDELLEKMNVDILVVGDDRWADKVEGHDFMVRTGRRVVYLPYTIGKSSTILRESLERFYNRQKQRREIVSRPDAARNRRMDVVYQI